MTPARHSHAQEISSQHVIPAMAARARPTPAPARLPHHSTDSPAPLSQETRTERRAARPPPPCRGWARHRPAQRAPTTVPPPPGQRGTEPLPEVPPPKPPDGPPLKDGQRPTHFPAGEDHRGTPHRRQGPPEVSLPRAPVLNSLMRPSPGVTAARTSRASDEHDARAGRNPPAARHHAAGTFARHRRAVPQAIAQPAPGPGWSCLGARPGTPAERRGNGRQDTADNVTARPAVAACGWRGSLARIIVVISVCSDISAPTFWIKQLRRARTCESAFWPGGAGRYRAWQDEWAGPGGRRGAGAGV
jgi:hypothetical protein